MPVEVAYDEPIEDPEHKFHVEVIYATVDSMVNALRQRTDGIGEKKSSYLAFYCLGVFAICQQMDYRSKPGPWLDVALHI